MKRLYNFVLLIAVVSFACLLFLSCKKKKERIPKESGNTISWRDLSTYSDGMVLYPNEKGQLCFFDATSEQGGLFCFNPACDHKRAVCSSTGDVIQEGCVSFEYSFPVSFIGDYLYYYSGGSNSLYRTDRRGNNMELVRSLSKPYEYPIVYCYTEEALYVDYTLSYEYFETEKQGSGTEWRAGNLKEKREVGILRIPFSGEKEEVIFLTDEYYDMIICEFEYCEGKLRFLVQGRDRQEPYVNVEDGSEEIQIEEELRHTHRDIYEYSIADKKLTKVCELWANVSCFFFDDTYGIINDSNRLALYSYEGMKVAESEDIITGVIVSDYGIVGTDKNGRWVSLSEKTGKTQKTSPFTRTDFPLCVVVGNSYYGIAVGEKGETSRMYITETDFWNGNKEGVVWFPE